MVIQEVKNLATNIFEQEGCEIDLSINYNENKTATLIVLYPDLYVENTEYSDTNISIKNFVFKISMSIKQINGKIHLSRFIDKRAFNLSPTAEMIAAGYLHSHVNNYSSNEICLGDKEVNAQWLKLSDYTFMNISLDEEISDVLFDFFFNFNKVFHIEDEDGGPWVRINEVHNGDNNTSIIEDIDEDDFNDVCDHYSLSYEWLHDYIDEHSYAYYNFCPDTVMYLLESFEVSRDILTDKRNNIIDYIYLEFINPLILIYPFRRNLNEYDSDIRVYNDALRNGLDPGKQECYSKFLFFCYYMYEIWEGNKNGSTYTYVNLIDDLETIHDEYDKVEINPVLSNDFCYFSTRTSDNAIFKREELGELFDHLIQDQKSDNNLDDTMSSLERTSFYINGKFYSGEVPDIDDLETDKFYINDYTENIYLYEQENKITKTITSCIELHSKNNSTIEEIQRYTSSFDWGTGA